MSQNIIEVRVTLKGRLIKEYRFSETRISIGRDPSSNIFLDNPGISREHAFIERRGHGIYVQDLGSANGTFLNDDEVRRERVREGDRVRIGKFSLQVGLHEDRRGTNGGGRALGEAHQGTMVLETAQIDRLMSQTKEAESKAAFDVEATVAAEGNVLRTTVPEPHVQVRALPNTSPVPGADPATGLAWWQSQLWGLAIGFSAGIVAGALLVRLLSS